MTTGESNEFDRKNISASLSEFLELLQTFLESSHSDRGLRLRQLVDFVDKNEVAKFCASPYLEKDLDWKIILKEGPVRLPNKINVPIAEEGEIAFVLQSMAQFAKLEDHKLENFALQYCYKGTLEDSIYEYLNHFIFPGLRKYFRKIEDLLQSNSVQLESPDTSMVSLIVNNMGGGNIQLAIGNNINQNLKILGTPERILVKLIEARKLTVDDIMKIGAELDELNKKFSTLHLDDDVIEKAIKKIGASTPAMAVKSLIGFLI